MECSTLNVLKCIPYSITCFNLKSSISIYIFYILVIKMLFLNYCSEIQEWFPVGQPETKQIEEFSNQDHV